MCKIQTLLLQASNKKYGIVGFNVPLDTLYVTPQMRHVSVHSPVANFSVLYAVVLDL